MSDLGNSIEEFRDLSDNKINDLQSALKMFEDKIKNKSDSSESNINDRVRELEKLNKKLETKLKKNESVLDNLKTESKNLLNEFSLIIKGLFKSGEEVCQN